MPRVIFLVFIWASLLAIPTQAVEMNGGYDATPPTNSNIPNWVTIGSTGVSGWGAAGITGWNYIGQVNGASGVYLGNGWVLTAGHVGIGNFTLAGTTYTAIPNSARTISNTNGTADLCLFQIAAVPALPLLTLSLSPPVAFSGTQTGTSVAMLGFGGGFGLTWGLDTVTETDQQLPLTGYIYVSTDFFTDNGEVDRGSLKIFNLSNVVSGDSGGGDFIYNATTQKWELAGINEITGSYSGYDPTKSKYYGNGTFSGMIQLATYASQINAIVHPPDAVDTPTMPFAGLFIMACLLIWVASRSLGISAARG